MFGLTIKYPINEFTGHWIQFQLHSINQNNGEQWNHCFEPFQRRNADVDEICCLPWQLKNWHRVNGRLDLIKNKHKQAYSITVREINRLLLFLWIVELIKHWSILFGIRTKWIYLRFQQKVFSANRFRFTWRAMLLWSFPIPLLLYIELQKRAQINRLDPFAFNEIIYRYNMRTKNW